MTLTWNQSTPYNDSHAAKYAVGGLGCCKTCMHCMMTYTVRVEHHVLIAAQILDSLAGVENPAGHRKSLKHKALIQ